MKVNLLILFSLILNFKLLAQNNDTWTLFWNKDSTLVGYKDKNGVVKIEPKFTSYISAGKFDNIIAAFEEDKEKWKCYYLTKSGKIVGRDSLYDIDATPDCENEGFIRFTDKKTNKVGIFNRNGEIVVPAIYNDLSSVRNGMIMALKGAKKRNWTNQKETGFNHYSWVGGKELLIDTLNNILIENFPYNDLLNFFSLKKTNKINNDPIRKSFLAKDGNYYSFVDFEKEFEQWVKTDLLKNLTLEKLINNSYDTIIWESKNGWAKTNKRTLITNNFTILKNGLMEVLKPEAKYFISKESLNAFMYDKKEFEMYFDNCGFSKDWIYPTISIITTHNIKKRFSQNHYEFLRTDNGYKLISLTIRSAKLQ